VGGADVNRIELTVRDAVFLGSKLILHFDAPAGARVVAELPAGVGEKIAPGDVVSVSWGVADTLVFPA
jgi:putative spermidine/putrescine transport system ATP-binding protein